MVDAIKGEIGFSWHLNVRNVTLNNRMSCESVSRGNEDQLQVHRPSNWRRHKQEDQEEAGKCELHIGKETLVCRRAHARRHQPRQLSKMNSK